MANRLPIPGSDDHTWGNILNDFLRTAHADDGTLKSGIITNLHVSDTAGIAKTKLAAAVQTSLNAADTAIQKVNGKTAAAGEVTLSASDIGSISQATADDRYMMPRVVGPTPTGVAATDTAALQAAINATPAGGRLWLPSSNTHYKINAALAVPHSMSIEGDSITTLFTPVSAGGNPTMPSFPYLAGTIIEQTAAAADIFAITASSVSVNLSRLGLLFTDGLASTGHGVKAAPALSVGPGHDMGLTDFVFEQVYVHGHDGDHYGFYLLNPQYGTVTQCRAYGGGFSCLAADSGSINSGNIVFVHPFNSLFNTGTAAGYAHSAASTSGAVGRMNLNTYIRPQCIVQDAAESAGTQAMWDDTLGSGVPQGITVISADFETATCPFRPGAGTDFVSNGLINNLSNANTRYGSNAFPTAFSSAAGTSNTALGNGALGANTTGANNVAVGYGLSGNTSGGQNVAVGNQTIMANTTGSNLTAVGHAAMSANTSGGANTAVGYLALFTNETASQNTAVGYTALKTAQSDSNTAVGANALPASSTGGANTAIGANALLAADNGSDNVAVGALAGAAYTSGGSNVAVGYQAGKTATAGNQSTTASGQTYVGYNAGQPTATQSNSATAVGYQASAGEGDNASAFGANTAAKAPGAVAIGTDSSGNGATTTTANTIALGTANHKVQISNNATGSGSATLGSNSPATTTAAPYTWLKMTAGDGTTVYVPAWK